MISAPTTGNIWYRSANATLTWTTKAAGSTTVTLQLYTSTGTLAATIASGAANTGSYTWTVPLSVSEGTYFVLIQDLTNSVYTSPSLTFTISSGMWSTESKRLLLAGLKEHSFSHQE